MLTKVTSELLNKFAATAENRERAKTPKPIIVLINIAAAWNIVICRGYPSQSFLLVESLVDLMILGTWCQNHHWGIIYSPSQKFIHLFYLINNSNLISSVGIKF